MKLGSGQRRDIPQAARCLSSVGQRNSLHEDQEGDRNVLNVVQAQKGLDVPLRHSAMHTVCTTEPACIPAIGEGQQMCSLFEKTLLHQVFAWWGGQDTACDTYITAHLVKCAIHSHG